ncbi:MAG: polysaccharide biosynthesis tyrosine autokinase [Phycicoccus sp.]|nr:polysaccharide biosynthesis tyrosine autokinase [Phycicoccus sp.]
MDLRKGLGVLRQRWVIVLVTIGASLAIAAIVTAGSPRTYESTVEFFVSTSDSSSNAQLASGGTFTQQRVKSYAQLVKTPRALDPVVEATGIGTTSELVEQVSASIPPDSVLLDVSVTGLDPAQVQAQAEGLARTFPETIVDIEEVNGVSPVKVTVVKHAALPTAAVSPRPVLNLLLGLAVGVLAAVGLALLRDAMDTKVRTKEDLDALTEATVLGVVAFDAEIPKRPVITPRDRDPGRAEAFRSLRTNLRFVDVAHHPRSIVMTSAIASEGKSTTVANLGLVLAELGARVCLVEADLRRPRLLDYFGMTRDVGLTDVLIGRHELSDVVQPYGSVPLFLLGSGPLPPNPSELLGSEPMRQLLDQLTATFDYVLFDTPPLVPVTDAAVLAAHADGVILVVGSGAVTRDSVAEALDRLSNVSAHVLGLVLNRLPRERGKGYYQYPYDPVPQRMQRSRRSSDRSSASPAERDTASSRMSATAVGD